eukprot:Pgem_evm1s19764
MENAKGVKTTGIKDYYNDKTPLSTEPYRQAVGSLLYVAIVSRPDLFFSVNMLARAVASPTIGDWKMVKHLIRYLISTKHYSLFYKKGEDINIEAWSDSDYGNCIKTRRSTTGYILFINGTPYIWKTTLQTTVALSVMEAEIMAIAAALKEILWSTYIMKETIDYNKRIQLNVDNQAAISVCHDPTHHERSKHIDIRYFRIKAELKDERLTLVYVKSEENCADPLT